jgi:hypothetical protein
MSKAWFALAVIALALLAVVSRYDYQTGGNKKTAYDRWTGASWELVPTGEKAEIDRKLIWVKVTDRRVGSIKREVEERTDSIEQIIEHRKRDDN